MLKHTAQGTPYLTEAEVVPVTVTNLWHSMALNEFLYGLDPSYTEYMTDYPNPMRAGEEAIKIAGQLCYLSFGHNRTKNVNAQKYFNHILESGHGSVLEHASVGFIFYGVSRSLTHELVRHRAGFSFSQVSQRYVDKPRFVERPEYQISTMLHQWFEKRIDDVAQEYKLIIERMAFENEQTSFPSVTEERKAKRQVARSILPNETEAPIMVTANIRAWRHFLEMRCSSYAETEIRMLAYRVYLELKQIYPMLFSDYTIQEVSNGDYALNTQWRKV